MRFVLFFVILLSSLSTAYCQLRLSTSELEKLLYLNISEADDFLKGRGFQYLGGDNSFGEKSNVMLFGTRDPFKMIVTIEFFDGQRRPNMVSYTCSEVELKAKKKEYLSNGFKLFNSVTDKNSLKYFFDRKGSYFYITIGEAFYTKDNYSFSMIQLVSKSKDYVE